MFSLNLIYEKVILFAKIRVRPKCAKMCKMWVKTLFPANKQLCYMNIHSKYV